MQKNNEQLATGVSPGGSQGSRPHPVVQPPHRGDHHSGDQQGVPGRKLQDVAPPSGGKRRLGIRKLFILAKILVFHVWQ